jgi:hypothetical protein
LAFPSDQPSARVAEAFASLSFTAHSSQQTSTTCPPIVTLIAFASNAQSQAAQHFSTMEYSPQPSEIRRGEKDHLNGIGRYQDL